MCATARPRSRPAFTATRWRRTGLKQAFGQSRQGRLGAAGYESALTDAIRGAVQSQEDVGLHSITDGEFGRNSWFGFFFDRMDGFRREPAAFRFRDEQGGSYEWPTCSTCARICRRGAIAVGQQRRLAALARRTPKMTLPAPSAFHFFRFHAPAEPAVYPDEDGYRYGLVDVYRAEFAALGDAGCRYLQRHEVPLATLYDPLVRAEKFRSAAKREPRGRLAAGARLAPGTRKGGQGRPQALVKMDQRGARLRPVPDRGTMCLQLYLH